MTSALLAMATGSGPAARAVAEARRLAATSALNTGDLLEARRDHCFGERVDQAVLELGLVSADGEAGVGVDREVEQVVVEPAAQQRADLAGDRDQAGDVDAKLGA